MLDVDGGHSTAREGRRVSIQIFTYVPQHFQHLSKSVRKLSIDFAVSSCFLVYYPYFEKNNKSGLMRSPCYLCVCVCACVRFSICVSPHQVLNAWTNLYKIWYIYDCRSQRPRGVRHELSSPSQSLGSWVRIPLEAWMSVLCAFILCLFCPVCR
jgi:hypothetical protein